ncbi:MAG: heme-binding Shp domain-containing protein [Peptoniphilaceae bacterium]
MKRIITILFLIVLTSTSVFASTLEIGRTRAYYEHPLTGTIEDAGKNPAIGQGMVESVLYPQALVETIGEKIYLTVRFNLASNIKNESFSIQNRGDNKFYPVDFEIVKEGEDTKDYRFEIPSKDIIVRSSFLVEAMGRDIIFYYDISNFTEGNTDFETIDKEEVINQKEILKDSNLNSKENLSYNPHGLNPDEKQLNNKENKIKTNSLGYHHGLLMKNSKELKKVFDFNDKNSDENEDHTSDGTVMGEITKIFLYIVAIIISLLSVIGIIASISSIFIVKRLKKERNRLMEEIDEE